MRKKSRNIKSKIIAAFAKIVDPIPRSVLQVPFFTEQVGIPLREQNMGDTPVPVGYITRRNSSDTLRVEIATAAEAPRIVETLADAFTHDPTWSWALPDLDARNSMWQLSVAGAIRYPWVFRTAGFEAVSVWIPPGGSEFTQEDFVPIVRFQTPDNSVTLTGMWRERR